MKRRHFIVAAGGAIVGRFLPQIATTARRVWYIDVGKLSASETAAILARFKNALERTRIAPTLSDWPVR